MFESAHRSARDERFYMEAVTRVCESRKKPSATFDEMRLEIKMFTTMLEKSAFAKAATRSLRHELPLMGEKEAHTIIERMLTLQRADQHKQLELLESNEFRAEVTKRAEADETPQPLLLIRSTEPACAKLLPSEPLAMATQYASAVKSQGAQSVRVAMATEQRVQHALSAVFDRDGKHSLFAPLIKALEGTHITTERPVEWLAESFLSARMKEAVDREMLLAPKGWIMQQLKLEQATGGWRDKLRAQPMAQASHTMG